MNARHTVVSVALLAALLMPLQGARAVEILSVGELALHCAHYSADPDNKDGIFCMRYIQGFIDGAVATDERVTYNVSARYTKSESYAERATRTRGVFMPRYATYYAEFCLGDPVPLQDVVGKVVAHLGGREFADEQLPARGVVYDVLRSEYPCEKED